MIQTNKISESSSTRTSTISSQVVRRTYPRREAETQTDKNTNDADDSSGQQTIGQVGKRSFTMCAIMWEGWIKVYAWVCNAKACSPFYHRWGQYCHCLTLPVVMVLLQKFPILLSYHQTSTAAAPALAIGIAKQPSDAENSDTVEVDKLSWRFSCF